MKDFLTVKQAAELLGVTPLTLRNWDKKKKLVAYRNPINNYRIYKVKQIEDFLNTISKNRKKIVGFKIKVVEEK